MSAKADRIVRRYGITYAEDAGITLRDKPSPLWRLLILALLLSARIDSGIAVKTARELSRSGLRTPDRTLATSWQERVDALGRGGYRRYDERTATQLAEAARLVLDRWKGDLRRLHEEAGEDDDRALTLLQAFKGIGPAGAAIFLREAQAVWPDMRPFVDELTLKGAANLGLPTTRAGLYAAVPHDTFHRLVAACVRAARNPDLVHDADHD